MDAAYRAALVSVFPALATEPFTETSGRTAGYNCIAWAAGETNAAWWPTTPGWYWPEGMPREETIEAFRLAFATRGLCRLRDRGF